MIDELVEGPGFQRVVDPAAAAGGCDDPGVAEHAQVVGEEWAGDVDVVSELAHASWALGERIDDEEAGGVTERPESGGLQFNVG